MDAGPSGASGEGRCAPDLSRFLRPFDEIETPPGYRHPTEFSERIPGDSGRGVETLLPADSSFGMTTWVAEGESLTFRLRLMVSADFPPPYPSATVYFALRTGLVRPKIDGEEAFTWAASLDDAGTATTEVTLDPHLLTRGRNSLYVFVVWSTAEVSDVGPFMVLYGDGTTIPPVDLDEPLLVDAAPENYNDNYWFYNSEGERVSAQSADRIKIGVPSAINDDCPCLSEIVSVIMLLDGVPLSLGVGGRPELVSRVTVGTRAVYDVDLPPLPAAPGHELLVLRLNAVGEFRQDSTLARTAFSSGFFSDAIRW